MPHNVEIKARAPDLDRAKSVASELASGDGGGDGMTVIEQRDVFFNASSGRLKLRFLSGRPSQLIAYERGDVSGPKTSDYVLAEVPDPEDVAEVLRRAVGVLGEVRKTRYLFLVGQTRIHCDSVEGLGDFVELEVVMKDGQAESEGVAIAEDLMEKLGVRKEDLISGAYMDLILAKQTGN